MRHNFAPNIKNIDYMKKKILIPIAVWFAMAGCLYGATFAEVSTSVKIVCGVASVMLYAAMILMPYLVDKRNGSEESLGSYLKSLLINE
jgi:hypothetical protein